MYGALIATLTSRYQVISVQRFLGSPPDGRVAILRHDVDRRVHNASRLARIASAHGATGTFYFRYPYTFKREVLAEVADLGHEIGYHYETMGKAGGDRASARKLFAEELRAFREVCRVDTACMHGSPMSRWDNRAIWKDSSPADFGLVGEPYLSIDFGRVAYLTDTGRGWNKPGVSVRDRVSSETQPTFRNTATLIEAVEAGRLADEVMLNIHPERWSGSYAVWLADVVIQAAKNQVKRPLARWRGGFSAGESDASGPEGSAT